MGAKRNRYQAAGVDVEAGYAAVERIKKIVKRTLRAESLDGLGGFGGCFALGQSGYKDPVLVAGTDGVGSKLLLAEKFEKYDTIGIDAVAMCVNDIVTSGAEPLFFLDYLAVGHMEPGRIEQLVAGVAEGCVQAGCALIGGETAEMPDIYGPKGFDIAGFAVGAVERSLRLHSQLVQAGDVLIGLSSSGLHANGYALVRQICFKDHDLDLDTRLADDQALQEALLEPTRIYVKQSLAALKTGGIHGMSHITGGGFDENIPRMLPPHLKAAIDRQVIHRPAIFDFLQGLGGLSDDEMFAIFNMGIGMIYAVAPEKLTAVRSVLEALGEKVTVLGEVVVSDKI